MGLGEFVKFGCGALKRLAVAVEPPVELDPFDAGEGSTEFI
jgi:hypothetical protein